jgi:UDPglucose--hexose-1-phosphate uridylyltransferase
MAAPSVPGAWPEPYDVRWFPNRWPPFPDARAEIVLYTPRHEAAFWELTPAEARRVIDLWADRTAALGRRDDVQYVLVFENRGAEVGATIAHPHGQIYGFDLVPPEAAVELERDVGLRFDVEGAGDRLIERSGTWYAYVPAAANWPYEMLLAPTTRIADLPSLDDEHRDDLAMLLRGVLARLDRLFDSAMPYMMWFHQQPTDGRLWPTAWLHLHIAPLYRAKGTPRFVAAGELGSRVFFNPIDPTEAAARLREA